MARITGSALALEIILAEEVNLPLETPILEVVSVEQVENPFNDQFGNAFDDGYLKWLDKNWERAMDVSYAQTYNLPLDSEEDWENFLIHKYGENYAD